MTHLTLHDSLDTTWLTWHYVISHDTTWLTWQCSSLSQGYPSSIFVVEWSEVWASEYEWPLLLDWQVSECLLDESSLKKQDPVINICIGVSICVVRGKLMETKCKQNAMCDDHYHTHSSEHYYIYNHILITHTQTWWGSRESTDIRADPLSTALDILSWHISSGDWSGIGGR